MELSSVEIGVVNYTIALDGFFMDFFPNVPFGH